MGGHIGGDIAADITIEVLIEEYKVSGSFIGKTEQDFKEWFTTTIDKVIGFFCINCSRRWKVLKYGYYISLCY